MVCVWLCCHPLVVCVLLCVDMKFLVHVMFTTMFNLSMKYLLVATIVYANLLTVYLVLSMISDIY